MIAPTTTDDPVALPTFENRLSAHLHAHGVDLPPGEYVVREARLIRLLAGLGFDEETMAEILAFVAGYPQLLLGDEWGPAPFTEVDGSPARP
jgi:hypothetical protein